MWVLACAPGARTPEAGDGGLSGCPESWVVVSSSSSSSSSSLVSEVSAYAAHPWRVAYSRRACDATRHDSTRRRVASGEREMDGGEAVVQWQRRRRLVVWRWAVGGEREIGGRAVAGRWRRWRRLVVCGIILLFFKQMTHTPNPLAPRPRPAGRGAARAPRKKRPGGKFIPSTRNAAAPPHARAKKDKRRPPFSVLYF